MVDTVPEDCERSRRVGCFGGFLVGRAAARAMLARGAGTILFTGAIASLRGGADFLNLASPKFAAAVCVDAGDRLAALGGEVLSATLAAHVVGPVYACRPRNSTKAKKCPARAGRA